MSSRASRLVALAALTAFSTAAGGAVAAGPRPAVPCAEVPGVNDRCPVWAATFDSPTSEASLSEDEVTALAVAPDGARVFVTGESTDDKTGGDFATVAYEAATGRQLWTARHHAPALGVERPADLAVSPDGSRLYVTGAEDFYPEGDARFATVAYDAATGERLWVATRDGLAPGNDVATGVVVSPDGRMVYVTGSSPGEDGDPDFLTVAYRAATGAELWSGRHDGPAGVLDTPVDLAVSPDGSRLYVGGTRDRDPEGGSGDYAVVAYEAADPERTGRELWVASYDGPVGDEEQATAMALGPDGATVFVTGTSEGGASDFDYATVGFRTSDGGTVWAARFGGARNDRARAIAVSPTGDRLFVTGGDFGVTLTLPQGVTVSGFSPATVAYDATTGEELWSARLTTPGHTDEQARDIAVSPDGGRVFVAGFSSVLFSNDGYSAGFGCSYGDSIFCRGNYQTVDFITIAYDAAGGSRAWTARFNGSGADAGAATRVVVSPEGGRLFVAGTSARPLAVSNTGVQDVGNYSDFWTLAYGG